eukprot:TRINITY_DN6513_c0_g1_i3.p1 TRINITY_DN6513_c0_g1~~TRINITY_DN6513_c0_g1_i3.p1  ORF type:complete len:968 (+),score=279.34 TRINITY_DN6513_c0_g1_i3:80-2983(+)
MGLSLRSLSIALSLACVVTGSVVAAFLAIDSGDNALSVTKDTNQEALQQCFATASNSVVLQTNELINALMDGTQDFVRSFMGTTAALAEELTTRLQYTHPRDSLDWNWLWKELNPYLWSTMNTKLDFVTACGVITAKKQLLWQFQDENTVYAPKDRLHRIKWIIANGTDYDNYGPTVERVMSGDSLYGTGGELYGSIQDPGIPRCYGPGFSHYHDYCFYDSEGVGNVLCPETYSEVWSKNGTGRNCGCSPLCNGPKNVDPVNGTLEGTGVYPKYDPKGCVAHPTMSSGPCVYYSKERGINFDPHTGDPGPFWLMGAYLVPRGKVMWSPPTPISNYVGLMAVGSWSHVAAREPPYSSVTAASLGTAGIAMFGLDLRAISGYLRSLKLEGLTRVYLSVARDQIGSSVGDKNEGVLLAASHGMVSLPAIKGSPNGPQLIIRPENSSDGVVAKLSQHVSSRSEQVLLNETAASAVDVPLDLTGYDLPEVTQRGNVVQRVFVKVRRLNDERGLDSWMVMCFDRFLIMGPIEAAERSTRDRITAANKKVDDDLQKDRTTLYIIVSAVAVAMIVISVVFVIAITTPLRLLGEEMEEVARMKLDGVTERLSVLSEVAKCQSAFLAMIAALKKYRDYMPLSVLQDDEDDEEAEDAASHQGSCKTGSDERGKGSRVSGSTLQAGTEKSSQRSMSVARTKQAQSKMAKGIQKKNITLMVIGVRGFHSLLDKDNDGTVAAHAQLVGTLVAESTKMKGVADPFCGDRMLISFNAVKPTSGHRQVGVRFGMSCKQQCSPSAWAASFDVSRLAVCMSVASGEVRSGNMGCPGMMKYSYLGKPVPWAFALQRFGQSVPLFGGGAAVYIDQWLAEEIGGSFILRSVDQVVFEKRAANPIVVSCVHSEKAVSEDEWMYQLEEGEKSNPCAAWNRMLAAVFAQELAEARQEVQKMAEERADDPIFREWNLRLEDMKMFTPTKLEHL